MTEIKPGWWRMTNGCVALIIEWQAVFEKWYGVIFDRYCACYGTLYWLKDGSYPDHNPRTLVSYLGTDLPVEWYVEPTIEKQLRPWTQEEMLQHVDGWFIDRNKAYLRAVGYVRPWLILGDSTGTTMSPDGLINLDFRWVANITDKEPQHCGVWE